MSGPFELVSEQLVVPDLAVVDDHDLSVLIRHRLRAARNVDDREPCVAKSNGGPWNVHSMPIGSAMTKRPNCAFQTAQVRKVCAYRRNGSGNAAHVRLQPAAASQRRGAIPLHEGTRRRPAPHALMERAPGTPSASRARLVSFAVDSGRNAGSGRAPLGWYVRRAQAMSARELAWRTAEPVRARLRRTPLRRPDWDTPGWTELLERLAGTAAPATTAAAARIAGGELCFWGRAARIDPLRPDWNVEPVDGDPKRVWELHRQQHLVPLALGSVIAERPDWARVCVDQLISWAASSPPGRGPAWSSGYEASHRLIGWAWTVPLVAREASARELALLADSYALQRQFVDRSPSRFSSANNHRIADLVGLIGWSMLSAGAGWHDTWRELEDEVALQTYPDGGSREQASGYFLYVLELLWLAGLFAQASGQSLGRLEERLPAPRRG